MTNAKYLIGNISFKKWEDVVKHTRKLLAKGCRQLQNDEFEFAKDLFTYHSNADIKLKHGVSSIRVGVPEYGSYFCFKFTDNNGFEQDISHKKCRSTTKKNPTKAKIQDLKNDRQKAYRHAVLNDIESFRNVSKEKICCSCNSRFNIQVDHVIPFVKLINDFENEYAIEKYPGFERHNDSLCTFRFSIKSRENALFVEKWQMYHKANAKYQLLCSKCNLAKSSGGVKYTPYLNH